MEQLAATCVVACCCPCYSPTTHITSGGQCHRRLVAGRRVRTARWHHTRPHKCEGRPPHHSKRGPGADAIIGKGFVWKAASHHGWEARGWLDSAMQLDGHLVWSSGASALQLHVVGHALHYVAHAIVLPWYNPLSLPTQQPTSCTSLLEQTGYHSTQPRA